MSNIIINGAQVVADAGQAIADPQGWRIGASIYPALVGFSLVDTGAPLPSPFIPQAWVWQGGSLVANSSYTPPSPPVPQSVTRFQALAELTNVGLYDNAVAAVTAAGGLTKLAWDNAVSFDRDSPTIAALAAALSLTSAQIDALFVAAAKITV
jgi:hypothetical protein